jgi:hypothetical protein
MLHEVLNGVRSARALLTPRNHMRVFRQRVTYFRFGSTGKTNQITKVVVSTLLVGSP